MGTHDMEASETFIRGRSRSSLRRELSSFSRRSLRSAMLCFLFLTSPPARISYGAGMPSIALTMGVRSAAGGMAGYGDVLAMIEDACDGGRCVRSWG